MYFEYQEIKGSILAEPLVILSEILDVACDRYRIGNFGRFYFFEKYGKMADGSECAIQHADRLNDPLQLRELSTLGKYAVCLTCSQRETSQSGN